MPQQHDEPLRILSAAVIMASSAKMRQHPMYSLPNTPTNQDGEVVSL
jgi:hypothetical protein